MTESSSSSRIKFLSGLSAFPLKLKFQICLMKYFFNNKRYPLFNRSLTKGSLIKIQKTLRELALCKVVRFNNHYYFNLTTPRWPSKAFDNMVAKGGMNILSAGTPMKLQIDTAILAITRKCAYNCKHCYEHYNLGEKEIVPINRWKEMVKELQDIGVNIIILSGGEPMLRLEEALSLIDDVDKNLSDIHIHTSGHGVTHEKALALKDSGLAAAGIGIDDVAPSRHNTLRGYEGAYQEALQAIHAFSETGIFTYLNVCLTNDIVQSETLHGLLTLAKNLGVGIVRFLEPKPCGGYIEEYIEDIFSEDDRQIVTEFYKEANLSRKYREYPLISYEAYYEIPDHLGCLMAGHSHLHIDSLGNVEPCVFLPISFGNILEEDFLIIYERMRKTIPKPLRMQCPSIYLSNTIKAKKNQGITLPIPFEEVEKEWSRMIKEL